VKPLIKLGILASGSGSNAQRLWNYFYSSDAISVALVASNRASAGVVARASQDRVPCAVFEATPEGFADLLAKFQAAGVQAVFLAGFLKPLPVAWIAHFSGKIWNLHPSLLPKFGGPGMYGMRVHRAVVAAGALETGITLHEVTERYDEGPLCFQARTAVLPSDTPELVAEKIHALELEHVPVELERLLRAGFLGA
jgi:phosphoribosylglycinamide formyltransferase-1